MNEQQEIREISLMDLALYCLEKWRFILVFIFVAGIFAGIYKCWSMERNDQPVRQETVSEDNTEPANINERSVESYQQIIKNCQKDVEAQADYLEHSTVMDIDPFCVSTGTLNYYMDGSEQLEDLITAYRIYIMDGSMAEELYAENKDVSVADLRYLISFDSSEWEAYRLEAGMRPKNLIIQLQIKMPDSKLCREYLEEAEKVMEAYSVQLQKMARHQLILLSSVQSERADSDIQDYQASLRAAYVEAVRNLQIFQEEMEAVLALEEEGAGSASESSSASAAKPYMAVLKYAALGGVLGGFLAAFVLMIVYIMSGRLHNTKAFAREFEMPMLGLIRDPGERRRVFGFIDAWIFRLEEGAFARLEFKEQVEITAVKVQVEIGKMPGREGVKKIMLAGTAARKDTEVLYAQLTSNIPEVSWSPYVQLIFQADAIKELGNYDGVLFLEKKGVSDSRLIAEERKMAIDRGVRVLGSVIGC